MVKKGQLTVFIILGVIILLVVGSILYFVFLFGPDGGADDSSELSREAIPIQRFVENCLVGVGGPGAYLLAAQGGFIYSYDTFLNAEHEQIAYHLELGERVAPLISYMEGQLNQFIADSLLLCLDNFQDFESYQFSYGEVNVSTRIENEIILVDVLFPIQIVSDNTETELSAFHITLPLRLGNLLGVRDEIVADLTASEFLDLDALSSYDVEVSVLPYDKQSMVFSLYDAASVIDEAPFHLNFAVKILGNVAPVLDFIPDFVVLADGPFTYQLNATDVDSDDLLFVSSNPLVGIEDGVISFTPASVGEIVTEICVRDSFAAEDCSTVRFFVEYE
jgi:hypothetical protein